MPLRRWVLIAVGAMASVSLVACSDDEPGNPASEGDPATSVPGNEPGDDDGGGMNGNPDAGGDDDTTGGSSPEGGTTGDPD